ncbi:hypothetical protein MMC22_009086, partial [Lobaria immixta]|nr:hypothetical protein [Lobaria immixta]
MARTRKPKPNELVIPDGVVYAQVNPHIWEAIEFLMNKLELVNLQNLNTDDRLCAICQLEFRQSRLPVKTVCGHVFCQSCIIMWLNPLGYVNAAEDAYSLSSGTEGNYIFRHRNYPDTLSSGTEGNYDEGSRENADTLSSGTDGDYDEGSTEDADSFFSGTDFDYYEKPRNSCPMCRNALFPGMDRREPIEWLSARLWLWDKAYAFAGVVRSEKEEYYRTNMWKYLNYCALNHVFEINRNVELESLQCSQRDLLDFAKSLKTQSLTPVRERLRKRLEKFGAANLPDVVSEE